jgi:phage regulator Rha-like protein
LEDAKPDEEYLEEMKKKVKKRKKRFENVINKKESIHKKIQLWANVYENEYALRLAIADADDDTIS